MGRSRRELLKTGLILGSGLASGFGGKVFGAEFVANSIGEGQEQALPPEATDGPWRNLRAVKEKKVFDMHTHCWETPTQGTNYITEKRAHDLDEWKDYTEELIASMDRHGVAQAALSPAFVPYEKYRDTSFKAHPDRFIKMSSMLTEYTKARNSADGRTSDITPTEAGCDSEISDRQ